MLAAVGTALVKLLLMGDAKPTEARNAILRTPQDRFRALISLQCPWHEHANSNISRCFSNGHAELTLLPLVRSPKLPALLISIGARPTIAPEAPAQFSADALATQAAPFALPELSLHPSKVLLGTTSVETFEIVTGWS